ncbi:MAG: ABC transporter ATP-binding protein [Candidatus Rifleibacteriota bacterium]
MMLQIRELNKKFGNLSAVKNLSFNIRGGDIIGFVGPNGAGKTTTLRILATIDEPSSGDVILNGDSIIDNPEHGREMIGFVPDGLPIHADMNVHEYLDFFARAYGIKSNVREKVIDDLETFTNLQDKKDKLLASLSKGMKQRVSIARALINDPDFIFMDEPAAGLDPRARIELRELLRVLSGQGKGILISSHILSELSEICNSALIIEKGELLKFGSIEDITNTADKTRKIIIRSINSMERLSKFLLLYPGIENPLANGKNIEVDFAGDDEGAAELLKELIADEHKIIEFRYKQHNLESIFMSITKGEVQ